MLIDEVLPEYDFGERHSARVAAPVPVVYAAARAMNADSSVVIRVLMALRGIVPRRLDLQAFLDMGFSVVAERAPEELVLGVVGRPWTPLGSLRRVDARSFASFEEPGFAKMAMNLRVVGRGPHAELATETRVACTDDRARRRFRAYWSVIRPFSGLIRTEMLRAIKGAAERDASIPARHAAAPGGHTGRIPSNPRAPS